VPPPQGAGPSTLHRFEGASAEMQSDKPFPLERVSLRARKAILQVFGGRHPSIHEVAKVSEARWVTNPGVGPATLAQISRVTGVRSVPTDLPCAPQLSDAELMKRLDRLQRELLRLQSALKIIVGHSMNGQCRSGIQVWHETSLI
jgi:hypothetical protein